MQLSVAIGNPPAGIPPRGVPLSKIFKGKSPRRPWGRAIGLETFHGVFHGKGPVGNPVGRFQRRRSAGGFPRAGTRAVNLPAHGRTPPEATAVTHRVCSRGNTGSRWHAAGGEADARPGGVTAAEKLPRRAFFPPPKLAGRARVRARSITCQLRYKTKKGLKTLTE